MSIFVDPRELYCNDCEWLGYGEDANVSACPRCGNAESLTGCPPETSSLGRRMLRGVPPTPADLEQIAALIRVLDA